MRVIQCTPSRCPTMTSGHDQHAGLLRLGGEGEGAERDQPRCLRGRPGLRSWRPRRWRARHRAASRMRVGPAELEPQRLPTPGDAVVATHERQRPARGRDREQRSIRRSGGLDRPRLDGAKPERLVDVQSHDQPSCRPLGFVVRPPERPQAGGAQAFSRIEPWPRPIWTSSRTRSASMFDGVAAALRRTNDMMSAGNAVLWRIATVQGRRRAAGRAHARYRGRHRHVSAPPSPRPAPTVIALDFSAGHDRRPAASAIRTSSSSSATPKSCRSATTSSTPSPSRSGSATSSTRRPRSPRCTAC